MDCGGHEFERLRAYVEERLANAPGCHDFDHTLRVFNNALRIRELERTGDILVIGLAALLHDIARPEEFASGGTHCHAVLGAEMCADILEKNGYTDVSVRERVALAVRRHRFRGGEAPESIEEKIVYDADKLDSIGAVGIGRAFHFAGRVGACVHNRAEEALASAEYSEGDSAYREYLVKLRHVPERMLTASGRRLAEERTAYMHEFFAYLNAEVFGND